MISNSQVSSKHLSCLIRSLADDPLLESRGASANAGVASGVETIPVHGDSFKKLNEDLLRNMMTFLPAKDHLVGRLISQQLWQTIRLIPSFKVSSAAPPSYDPRGYRKSPALSSLLSSQALEELSVEQKFLKSNVWRNIEEKSINVHILNLEFYRDEHADDSIITDFFAKFKYIHTLNINISGELGLNLAKISPELFRTMSYLNLKTLKGMSSTAKAKWIARNPLIHRIRPLADDHQLESRASSSNAGAHAVAKTLPTYENSFK